MYPGWVRFDPQIDPSSGDHAIPYIPNGMRVSLSGSTGCPGSLYPSSRLPLPLVSTISAVQPCDFAWSLVSQNILVLTHPTIARSFCRLLLSHSVLSASSAKFRWCVPKQVSIKVNFFVFGSQTVTCREFWTKPSGVLSSG